VLVAEAMLPARSAALLLVSFVSLTACDRFRHAKYERSPWGASTGAPVGGAAGAGSSVATGGSDMVIRSCQSAPQPSLSTAREAGGACRTANDCAPVCCSCSASEWLASSCVNGLCASGETTCSRTTACPDPVRIVVIGGGGGSGAGGSSGSPGGDGTADCGLTFDDASCNTCMRTSCCAAVAACAADAVCSNINGCIADCGGNAACVDACDGSYTSNGAARQLDSCLSASCAAPCR
jgi:hypothetical protein